jgi:hypothetical protein
MKDRHLAMAACCWVRFRTQGTQHLNHIENVAFAGKAPRRM